MELSNMDTHKNRVRTGKYGELEGRLEYGGMPITPALGGKSRKVF
jgi:hypothetical protein